jgi:hypothetical protein
VVDSSGQMMDVNDDVTVERLWDDGGPVNTTTLKLRNGVATYTLVSDAAHVNSTLNLVVSVLNYTTYHRLKIFGNTYKIFTKSSTTILKTQHKTNSFKVSAQLPSQIK